MIGEQNIQRKLLGLVLIPTLLMSALLGYFGVRDYQLLREGLWERGISQARYLAEVAEFGLVTGNHSQLSSAANNALEQGAAAAWIYDAQGNVAVAVGQVERVAVPLTDRVDGCGDVNGLFLFCAPARMVPLSIDHFTEFGGRGRPEPPIGHVVVALSSIDLAVRRAAVAQAYAGVFAIIAILTFFVVRNVERQLASPIARLREAVERAGGGDLSARVTEDAEGELRVLQQGFNGMAQSLENNQAELERRIEEATSRLRQTLQKLEERNLELGLEKQRAEAASIAKSRFLAVMSHEIRTPLSGMVGMLSLLEQSGLKEEQADFIRHVESAAETLRLLIDEILDYSRIEAGKLAVVNRPIRLMTVIDEVVNMLAPSAADKRLEFVVHIEADVPDGVNGDALRLRQVLINLTANAIKFTEKGKVRMHLQRVGGTDERPRVRFAVEDTGIGIPPAQQDQVFESFTQVDSGTTRRYSGSGLGAAVSRELVHLMDGEIGFNSTLGIGSQFWFEVPFDIDRSVPQREQLLLGKKVAVVDHDSDTRAALVVLLEGMGAHATAIDAAQGKTSALFAGEAFDYLFLCESGPADTMHALAKESRKQAAFICHVAPMTCKGADGYDGRVSKPVTKSRLLSAIGGTGLRKGTEPPRAEVRPLRVLIAEDDEINARVIESLLGKMGHTVTRARDGLAALSHLQAEAFDIAILDIRMPEMDGPTVARRWRNREQETGGYLPMVALTANGSHEDMELCREAGIDEFLVKPVSATTLAIVLEMLVSKSGLQKISQTRSG